MFPTLYHAPNPIPRPGRPNPVGSRHAGAYSVLGDCARRSHDVRGGTSEEPRLPLSRHATSVFTAVDLFLLIEPCAMRSRMGRSIITLGWEMIHASWAGGLVYIHRHSFVDVYAQKGEKKKRTQKQGFFFLREKHDFFQKLISVACLVCLKNSNSKKKKLCVL